MLLCADLAGKKTSIDAAPAVRVMVIVSGAGRNDDHSRCLLFDTPLDLIDRHVNQTVFQTTFHIGTR
jgi:hypothetical protein